MNHAAIHHLTVYRLRVPPGRTGPTTDPRASTEETTVVCLETARGLTGYGEACPPNTPDDRDSGSITETIGQVFGSYLMGFHPDSWPAALEFIESLPWMDEKGQACVACRAAIELALLDLSRRVFDRDLDAVVRWMGLPGFGSPGSVKRVRIGAAPLQSDPSETARTVRRLYWRGLRHFKLEVGRPDDRDRLARVVRYLRKPIAAGRASLRVDARGRWSKDEAVEWLSDNDDLPIAAVVQPLPRGREDDLPVLKDLFATPLIHDASLVTMHDARRLQALGVADGFYIRVDKCGGLMASLRLAGLARREGIRLQLGVSSGATGLLLAAGLRFLEVCPGVEWFDHGSLTSSIPVNIARQRLRFRLGRRPPRTVGPGMGIEVDPEKLKRCALESPTVLCL